MFQRAWLLLPLACMAAGAAWAADDPMVGSWKLNSQKSSIFDEMKVTSQGGNQYAFDFGGGQPEAIIADGADHPAAYGTTFAVTPASATEWKVVRKKDGRVLITAIWTLSDNGSTLHDDYTEIGDQGKTTHLLYTYGRKGGGGSGFAGDWVSTVEERETAYLMQVQPYEGDGLTFIFTSNGVTRNVKFDGNDYPTAGMAVKVLCSAQRVNERKIEVMDKVDGKVRSTREIGVSDDGKTLTMTVHAGERSEPDVLVFERE